MFAPPTGRRDKPPPNMALCPPMSDSLSDNAASVLELLTERPTLNTAALLSTHHELDTDEVEAALHELRDAGEVRQTPMGWKLPRR
jgi:DNA-binding IclR family transcriptional regulator